MLVSWKVFFIAIGGLVVVYYFILVLALYRKEILNWIKSRWQKSTSENLPVVQNKNNQQDENSRETFGMLTQEEPNTIFSRSSASQYMLIGSVSDLLQEIKSVTQLAAESQQSPKQVRILFEALLSRYTQLATTSHKETINVFLIESCKAQFGFDLLPEEVNAWWAPR